MRRVRCVKVVATLGPASSDSKTLRRLFEIQLLSLAGYKPQLDRCVSCKASVDKGWLGFDIIHNGVLCEPCNRRIRPEIRFQAGILNYLKKLVTLEIKNCDRLKFPRGACEEIEKVTHRLIVSHTGRELKSYPFIKQMAAFSADEAVTVPQ